MEKIQSNDKGINRSSLRALRRHKFVKKNSKKVHLRRKLKFKRIFRKRCIFRKEIAEAGAKVCQLSKLSHH